MALVVGLIMLVVMTLVAVVSFKLAQTSMEVVGNMQATNAVVASANSAVEEAISTTRLTESPGAVFIDPCGGNNNTRCFDVNDDGVSDITVTLTPEPTCVNWRNIQNVELDLSREEDANCTAGTSQLFGVDGVDTGNSICANSLWEINAQASDAVTAANTVVAVGAAVRVPLDDVITSCP